ncbi:MAG: hypothetical protein EON96_01145 [Caulobacteraceae bacterium]|nr:MAG: hypothetical protein EON96_01145 [Caulobacteraceae bacterium]
MIDRYTGRRLDPRTPEYLEQAIADVLMTPIGSRQMRRTYGSNLRNLVDQPMNPVLIQKIYAATAIALMRWLPIVRLTRVQFERIGPGKGRLRLFGRRTDLPGGPAFSSDLSLPLAA